DDALSPQAKYLYVVLAAVLENPDWKPYVGGLASVARMGARTIDRWIAELQGKRPEGQPAGPAYLRLKNVRDGRGRSESHDWTLYLAPGDQNQEITRRAPTVRQFIREARSTEAPEMA